VKTLCQNTLQASQGDMLQIKTYLSGSCVHGMGLFAAEDIRQGEVIWRLTPGIDQVYSPRQLVRLCSTINDEGMSSLCSYIYKKNNRYYLLSDNARFINHSETDFNVAIVNETTEVATRDILAGEELLENYYASYDNDDPFFFEIRGICVEGFLSLTKKEKKRIVTSKDLSR